MLLEVDNLTIEFHDHIIPETVVNDVSFQLNKGEIVGLVGESGSGKSMTALAIAGLLNRKDMKKTGQILFEGMELLTCERKQLRSLQGNDIAMVFQEPMTSLNPLKKIGWQVEESLRVHEQLSPEELKSRAIKAMYDAELNDCELIYEQYPHQLSGGMRQRVMIAAAIISNPKVLIADEPTTALDVTVQAEIIKLLLKLNQEKKTAILFISHDLNLVKQLCKRIIVMRKGSIVEINDTDALFLRPTHSYTKQLLDAVVDIRRDDR